MKYFINRENDMVFKKALELKKEDYVEVDLDSENIYVVENNEGVIGVFDYEGIVEFLIKNIGNVLIKYYRVDNVFKLATLVINDKPVLKLHTYAYNCMDMFELFKYISKDNNMLDDKVYFDITYLVDGVEFKARFENINDLGIMIDEIEDRNIIIVEMSSGNKIIANIKYFDDRDDIFTIELFNSNIHMTSELIDLFEEYLG